MLETLCIKRPPSLGNGSLVSSRTLGSSAKDGSVFTNVEEIFTANQTKSTFDKQNYGLVKEESDLRQGETIKMTKTFLSRAVKQLRVFFMLTLWGRQQANHVTSLSKLRRKHLKSKLKQPCTINWKLKLLGLHESGLLESCS